MKELLRYHVPLLPAGPAVLRHQTIAWRGERELVLIDADGARTIAADWPLDYHELTPDGCYLLARGDEGRRAQVWETGSGRRMLELSGDEVRPESLRASLGAIGGDTYAFVFSWPRRHQLALLSLDDGKQRGWLSTSAMSAFRVERVIPLGGDWLGIHGYRDGEYSDTVVAIPAQGSLDDYDVLQAALLEQPRIWQWGHRVAIGPAEPGRAVVYRDAEWDDENRPDDPDEAFRGLEIRDLAARKVVERIPHDDQVPNLATIGASPTAIAIEMGGHVNVVTRPNGEVRRVDALALDPYRLEVASADGEHIVITTLEGPIGDGSL
jgi:hypothetical protein